MPTPTKGITLAAKHANLVAGTHVTFTNLTRGGKQTVDAVGGEALATAIGWEEGDVVSISVTGLYNHSRETVVNKGAARLTLGTMNADTSTPGVDL